MSEPKEPPKKFKVAELAIDENGVFWFIYIGKHPDQGGPTYRWGSMGLHDPASLGRMVQAVMEVESPEYLKKMKEKANQDPKTG